MADENRSAAEPVKSWTIFPCSQTITGMKLLDLVDWVCASNRVLSGDTGSETMPIIAMPPVQRSAVWRPKQVLDLWDSLMRGLPIGTFYLVDYPVEQPPSARKLVRLGGTANNSSHAKTQESGRAGFELLDGQQRVRALLAGAYGPAEGRLCLWVDLGAEGAKQSPCLRVTSKAQPFGYDGKSGDKLSLKQRRKAREEIEPDREKHPLKYGDRPAYDLDLFDKEVTQDRKRIEQPPRPYDATGSTFKLHDLLDAWRKRAPDQRAGGIAALRDVLPKASHGNTEIDLALRVLDEAFQQVEQAQVALLRVDPGKFHDPKRTLLTLFERIGAGGTPLSAEERLFSIYKHYAPEIRDAVDAIYDRAGRVLPPTKIAATALRVANASTTTSQYTVPNVSEFSERMAADPPSELHRILEQLVPVTSTEMGHSEGLLSDGFVAIKGLLSYSGDEDAFWMPDVLLGVLPAELWQVLVFWATRRLKDSGQAANLKSSREEVVRFALFWHFFVWDNEKAARWAFADIKDMEEAMIFPGAALYRRLIGTEGRERCAYALILPNEFTRRLRKEHGPAWHTDKVRFGEDKERNEIGAHWWWSGRKVLPWLQREYIRSAFPDYVPLTDHEDDLPYELDHMCPYSDWGRNWTPFEGALQGANCLTSGEVQSMRQARFVLGSAIGNLRLIDASTNSSDRDDAIQTKMPFVVSEDEPLECERKKMVEMAFNPEQRATWKKASGEDRRWDAERLCAFQEAVEQRSLWLYQCFYKELTFERWVSAATQVDRPASNLTEEPEYPAQPELGVQIHTPTAAPSSEADE